MSRIFTVSSEKYPDLQVACDVAESGDTIYVKIGSYDESVNLPTGVNIEGELPWEKTNG